MIDVWYKYELWFWNNLEVSDIWKKGRQISNEDWQKIENDNRYFDGKQWWVDPIWSPELLPQKQ